MKHTFDFHVHSKSLVITHWLNIEITVNVLRFCYFVCTEPHFCHISCSFKMTSFCADFFVFVHTSAIYFLNSLRHNLKIPFFRKILLGLFHPKLERMFLFLLSCDIASMWHIVKRRLLGLELMFGHPILLTQQQIYAYDL